MEEARHNRLLGLAKRNLAATSAVLSFLALAGSVAQSFLANVGAASIALLIAGTLLAILYNAWIIIAVRRSPLDPSVKLSIFSSRYRITVHILSFLLLVLSWTVTTITTSHKYFGHTLFWLAKYELASKHLKEHIRSSNDDYRASYELAKSYEHLGDTRAHVETLEALSKNAKILDKFKALDRSAKVRDLHMQIALTLIGPDYIDGIQNPRQRAQIHLEKARLLGDNPAILLMSGFMRATEPRVGNADKATESYVTTIYETSRKLIDNANFPENDYKKSIAQYHYWFGRSLHGIGRYEQAKQEFENGIKLSPKGTIINDMFLYRLGVNEFFRVENLDLPGALHYWKQMSDKNHLGEALTLTGLGLWHQGWDAENRGKAQLAKERFEAARIALSQATKLGQRSFKLFFFLGIRYFNVQDYVNAAANFEEAIKISPRNSTGLYWLGRSKFLVVGALTEAQHAMTRAAELDPSHSDTRYWLGRIAAENGDKSTAISEYKRSIELDKSNAKVYMHLVQVILLEAEGGQRNSGDKISQYETALRYANRRNRSREGGAG